VKEVFHSQQVLLSNWRQSILAEVFPQFLQTNAGILSLLGEVHFLQCALQFVLHLLFSTIV